MDHLTQNLMPSQGKLVPMAVEPAKVAAYRRVHEGAVADPDCPPATPGAIQQGYASSVEKRNERIIAAGEDPFPVPTLAEIMVRSICDPYAAPITDQEMDELVLALRRANREKYRGGGWSDPHHDDRPASQAAE